MAPSADLLPPLLLQPPRPLLSTRTPSTWKKSPQAARHAHAAAMADGKDESENQDQASDEDQPRLDVGDGQFAVRVATYFRAPSPKGVVLQTRNKELPALLERVFFRVEIFLGAGVFAPFYLLDPGPG